MDVKEARIFGRVKEAKDYLSIFECSCGSREWIVETPENPRHITCMNCGERYLLLKKLPNLHYSILPEAANDG